MRLQLLSTGTTPLLSLYTMSLLHRKDNDRYLLIPWEYDRADTFLQLQLTNCYC